ncbi:MAG: DUF2905 domain-containing protein [Parachlamydia sp.]|nr:DUF2905 domain-containing protein [Parachlamydia sp.]
MPPFDRLLIIAGLILTGIGLLLYFKGSIPYLGKLPGDITIKGEHFHFYFPLTTSLLISLVLSIVLYLLRR